MKASTLLLLSGPDADAARWRAAAVANGGSVSSRTLRAVSRFCRQAKAAGYWTKLNRVNLFCGDQLSAALVPLKVGGGGTTDANTNFLAADYTEATGLTGNGSTKYLNTALNPATTLTANSTHMAVYNRASAEGASGATMGCYTTGGVEMFSLYAPLGSDGKLYSNQYTGVATTGGRIVSASALSTPYGFCIGSRTAANVHTIYRNGGSLGSNAGTPGNLPSLAFPVFALSNAGVIENHSSAVLAGYSLGAGLTAADVTAYNEHMQEFQTALGRNV